MDLLTTRMRSAGRAAGEDVPRGGRVRALLAAAGWPLVTGYAVVAALFALVTAIATRSQFSALGVLLAAGPGWLGAYQVPVQIEGEPLGVLPLLPTIGVCVLVARTAASAAQRLGLTEPSRAVPLISVMAVAHAVLGLTISLLSNGETLSVEPLSAFLVPGLVAGVSAAVGVARHCGFTATVGRHLDPLAVHGLRAGALGLLALLTVGSFALLAGMAFSVQTANSLFANNAPGAGSAAGMLLLSLGYVPNAAVLALGFVTGPGFSIGSVSVGPYAFTGGPVPGVPLLAAMPEAQASWWPVFVLLPIAAGALVGWSLRRCHENPMARLRTVGVAGALVGFGTVVLGTLAGGRLGSGVFDPVAIPLGLVSIAAFLWIAVPGGLVAWFAGPRPQPEPEPEPAAVEEPVEEAGGEDSAETEAEQPDEAAEEEPGEDEGPGDAEEPEDDDFDDTDEATEVTEAEPESERDIEPEPDDETAPEPEKEPEEEPEEEPERGDDEASGKRP
ncbi:cell division protein PerM [Prauserella flavalba]|uniref:Uncharacterized protein n=1 Tax=Prauserella flavalba TaxID=1477506 RepID=A0A318M5J9_9PSEU|nr:DUF6350 family protein [Prauserella flavalba]PXY38046.1 hypothetical protein BA062_05465 [Prauserella flavalba]